MSVEKKKVMNKGTKFVVAFIAAVLLAALTAGCVGGNAETFTVTLELNGGTGVRAQDFIDDGVLVLPTEIPSKEGYVFGGWFTDKECTKTPDFGKAITSDITLYALWTEKTPVATFVFGSWTEEVKTAAKEGIFTPPSKKRTGYVFGGWFTDNSLKTKADFTVKYTEDAVFYAKWTAEVYTLSYNLSDLAEYGVNTEFTYTVEDKVTLADPSRIKDGYEFLGWEDENGESVNEIPAGSTGDRTFKARFIGISVTGGTVNGFSVNIGVPYSDNLIDIYDRLSTLGSGEITVYDANGASVVDAVALIEGDNAFTAVVSAYGEERAFSLTVTRYENVAFTVKVVFPDQSERQKSVSKGDTAYFEPIEIPGYEFENWYSDKDFTILFDFNRPVLKDETVYAKYISSVYNVTYFVGKGTHDNPATYTSSEGLTLKDAAAPYGYLFAGWYADENYTEKIDDIPSGTYGNKTLYALYEVAEVSDPLDGEYLAVGQKIALADLPAYFDWAVIRREGRLEFTVTDRDFNLNEDLKGVLDKLTVPVVGLTVSYSGTGNDVVADFTYSVPTAEETADLQTQYAYYGHEPYQKVRSDDFDDFYINYVKNTFIVSDSEQLFYAVEKGYRPLPETGSSAEAVYLAAKDVLRNIADDSMSDYEKVHAIYDWLILNVVYDTELWNIYGRDPDGVSGYKGFYLEGVFLDNRAVCDGISKAMVLLCGIEGIPCVQIKGQSLDGVNHAWNKVLLDGKWYVADATGGNVVITGAEKEILSHAMFLIGDEEMAKYNTAYDGTELLADKDYDYYGKETFAFDGKEYYFKITSYDALIIAMEFLAAQTETYGTQSMDFELAYLPAKGFVEDLGAALTESAIVGKVTYIAPDEIGSVFTVIVTAE